MSKKIALILLSSIFLFALAGCGKKKPGRQNPLDTVLGGGSYQTGPSSQSDALFNQELAGTTLTERRPMSIDGKSVKQLVDEAERGVIPDVLFQFDSSSIAPAERSKLAQAAALLQDDPRAILILEGHCDWRGTQEYNLALGDRRAKSVEKYLQTLGVSSDRLRTLSQGDLKATEGASSATMRKERRVEVLVIR